jgi:hypothetical protein
VCSLCIALRKESTIAASTSKTVLRKRKYSSVYHTERTALVHAGKTDEFAKALRYTNSIDDIGLVLDL